MNLAKILLGSHELYLLLWLGGQVGQWINVEIGVTSALIEIEIGVAFRLGLSTFIELFE